MVGIRIKTQIFCDGTAHLILFDRFQESYDRLQILQLSSF